MQRPGFSLEQEQAILPAQRAARFPNQNQEPLAPHEFRLFDEDRRARPNGRMQMAVLSINGRTHNVDVDPNTPLLWALRENVGLTGTKYGCGIAQCGACTVHVDGVAVRSCSVPVSAVVGKEIITIEGLAVNGVLHKVQKAWIDHDVPQCGYCQTGMIMAVADLLKQKPKPTDADIDGAITNICRCGTFQQVRAAIHAAAAA
jgi:isoquinoline 1-oxidoreductase subunit alpha